MKKFLLSVFILLDLAVIAGASYFLYTTIETKQRLMSMPSSRPAPLSNAPIVPSSQVPGATAVNLSSASPRAAAPVAPVVITPSMPYRNIGFTYKNTKARQVLIRADFTGWKGVTMKHDPNGIWSYSAQLKPGEYAYCFTVDDRIIKDPANKHTKRIAQTLVSSIVVEKVGATKAAVEP
jgi:hypothetical protein